MTGTALTEEEEFASIYAIDVVEIPTNRPVVRVDHPDVVYKTQAAKYRAVIRQILECHEKGQPVLVGTISIEKSELLSKLLSRQGVVHTVLNAKYHEKEAEIVAQAGRFGRSPPPPAQWPRSARLRHRCAAPPAAAPPPPGPEPPEAPPSPGG